MKESEVIMAIVDIETTPREDTPSEKKLAKAAKELATKPTVTLEDLEEYNKIARELPVIDFSVTVQRERARNTPRYQEAVRRRRVLECAPRNGAKPAKSF